MAPIILDGILRSLIEKFIPEEHRQNLKTVNLKVPHMCWKYMPYAKNKNTKITVTNSMNYFEGEMSLENAYQTLFIFAVNQTAWNLSESNASDNTVNYFSELFYTLRDEFLDNHTEEENSTFLKFLD